MSGFKSKRQAATDLFEAEERWEREQGDLLHDFAVGIFAAIGLMATSAATGFFLGLMYATQGGWFK
jgi:hypothetical protein